MTAEEQTGVHKAIEVVSRPFSLNWWRLWVTVLLVSLTGDHVGAWDVDSIFVGGKVDLQQAITTIASVMAVISAVGHRSKNQRAGDK